MASTSNTGRTAIVTGGSGGIGRAVVERLAADGLAVVASYSGNAERAESVATAIRERGGTASAFQADIGEEQDVVALFDHATEQLGGIDVVVNTAGLMILHPIVEYSVEDF